MPRILYFDCFSGASGDMILGACVDAGLPIGTLREAIGSLGLAVRLDYERVTRGGIAAARVTVREIGHHHHHDHEHAPHAHAHDHDETAAHEHHHRGLGDILCLIDQSQLPRTVKDRSAALFRRLAEAEGAVHGIAPEQVHFHEVGAIDSIVDIVGSVFALDWFGAQTFVSSPLNTGSGTVRCQHGVMPVPAPATARLLTGVPAYARGPAVELLTPTGALLVTAYAQRYGSLPPMTIEHAGYGAGDRDFPDRANVLRLVVGEALDTTDVQPVVHDAGERLIVAECEVDDSNPQVLGAVMQQLLDAGARDVYYTAVQMKKNRPGTLVTVLADPARVDALLSLLFSETTTLGVRTHEVRREALDRERHVVSTAYGAVHVKIGRREGRIVNVAPEFDECLAVAQARGIPVKEVLAAAYAAWRGQGGISSG